MQENLKVIIEKVLRNEIQTVSNLKEFIAKHQEHTSDINKLLVDLIASQSEKIKI